jgi:hypothetical protein
MTWQVGLHARQASRHQWTRAAIGLTLIAGSAGSAPVSPSPSHPAVSSGAGVRHVPAGGRIEPGTYFITEGPWTPATFSFTMPAGWVAENGGQTISKHANESGREVGWSVSIVDSLFADPCGSNETIDVGPTADDLAVALRALPGPDVAPPLDVTMDERPWKVIQVTVPADVDIDACDPPIGLQIWLDRSGDKYFLAGPESVARVYTVDVDGARFVIVANHRPTSVPDDVAEMEAILASIEFDP